MAAIKLPVHVEGRYIYDETGRLLASVDVTDRAPMLAAQIVAALNDTAERDRLKAMNAELVGVVTEWLPIVQRQLDGLLTAAAAQDGAKSLFTSRAWKTANERVDRARAALAKAIEGELDPSEAYRDAAQPVRPADA